MSAPQRGTHAELRGAGADDAGAQSDGPARRPVGGAALFALGLNGIVGVGIFFVPSELARLAPGRASIGVLAVTALALAPVAYGVGLLGSRFDEDGGPVLYARAAFGERVAFAVGWLAYVSASFSTAATLSGMARGVAELAGVTGAPAERALGIAMLTLLTLIAAAGIRVSANVWSTLTVAKLVPLVALAGAAVLAGAPFVALADGGSALGTTAAAGAGSAAAGASGTTAAAPSLLRAALTATFAYQGFEIVPVIAGQVRSSRRVIPRAVVGALLTAAGLYLVLQAACVAGVGDLAASAFPLADAARTYGGPSLAALVRGGISVSALGIVFGMVTMTPRYLSALAATTGLGFGLARYTARGAPLLALAVTWTIAAALVATGELGELLSLASIAVVTQYALGAGALVVLSARRERDLTPRDAWPALATLAVAAALLSSTSSKEWLVAAATLALGLLLRACAKARSPERPA